MKKFIPKIYIHIIAAILLVPTVSFSATLYVGESQTYSTIQSAVDAANDDDEIIVKFGKYVENIAINKSVSIRSESGYASTTIVMNSSANNIFYVTADKVRIEGFSLYRTNDSYDDAIYLYQADQCIIMNNLCGFDDNHKNSCGIILSNSHKNTIINNMCMYNSTGILLDKSTSNIISKNRLMHNIRHGLYLRDSKNNLITQNTMEHNNEYGLYLYGNSSQNQIYHNSFVENQIDSVKSNNLNQNLWNSPTTLIYSYAGNKYKSYLGNYYSDHKPFGTTENGISDHIYKYPYVEPCDEFPLLQHHDQYITQTQMMYPGDNLQLSSHIQLSEIHIGRSRSLMWTESIPAQTETAYSDYDVWKGQIHLKQSLSSNSILKIEINWHFKQSV